MRFKIGIPFWEMKLILIIAEFGNMSTAGHGSVTHLGQAPEGFQAASPATVHAGFGRWVSG
jgi:hypothetical protein